MSATRLAFPSPLVPASLTLPAQMLACSFLWGSSFLFIKAIGQDVTPFALTALRGVMGAVLIGGLLLLRGEGILPRGREWRDWAILGLLQGIIPNTLVAYALTTLPAGLTAFLQSTTPLVVAVLAGFLFAAERLTLPRAVGVFLGFAGVAVLLAPTDAGLEGANFLGVAAMAATVMSYALGNLYVPGIPGPKPLRLAFGQQAFAGLPTMAVLMVVVGPGALAGAEKHLLTLAALGLFATAVPIVLYMNILRRAGPTLGSMYGYLIPVWTTLLAALWFGETVTGRDVLGGLIVLSGLVVVGLTRRRRVAVATTAAPPATPEREAA